MFHLQPSDELAFGNPTSDSMYLNDEMLFMDHGFAITGSVNLAGTSNVNRSVKKRKEAELRNGEGEEELRKRAMHRDIERKRRQEMSQLYDTLRSLIPHELQLKGKRSIPDLMNEAVSYTKQLEKNIQESGIRRDKLRGLSTILSSHTKIGSINEPNSYVTVKSEQDGIEILMNTITSEFGLSRVMIELVARELDVISCVSTKSDDRFLYKIMAQVSDTKLIDLSVLQQRLAEVVNLSLLG